MAVADNLFGRAHFVICCSPISPIFVGQKLEILTTFEWCKCGVLKDGDIIRGVLCYTTLASSPGSQAPQYFQCTREKRGWYAKSRVWRQPLPTWAAHAIMMTYKTAKRSTFLEQTPYNLYLAYTRIYTSICINYSSYSICSPLRTIWCHKSLSLPGALFYTRPDWREESQSDMYMAGFWRWQSWKSMKTEVQVWQRTCSWRTTIEDKYCAVCAWV